MYNIRVQYTQRGKGEAQMNRENFYVYIFSSYLKI